MHAILASPIAARAGALLPARERRAAPVAAAAIPARVSVAGDARLRATASSARWACALASRTARP